MIEVVYNGYSTVKYIPEAELDNFIKSVINEHIDLKPRKIFDCRRKDVRVIVYQYRTLYQEVFVVRYNSW